MADTKISALPASTTPLAGTEVLPIVQSGVTRQVSVANLTAGRAISASQITLSTGNLIVANGQGVDFSATPGTGTSELLADYEEGTWSPVLSFGGASVGITYAGGNRGRYTKIGNTVVVNALLELTNKGSSTGVAAITGLPFATGAYINYVGVAALYGNITVAGAIQPLQIGGTSNINLYEVTSVGTTTQLDNTDFANNSYVFISMTYQVGL